MSNRAQGASQTQKEQSLLAGTRVLNFTHVLAELGYTEAERQAFVDSGAM